jgi:6-phosphogluconolactonase
MTVVETVVTTLEHLIADRGRARIAFPGGRSAVGLMQELATKPLEWSAIDVTLVDERAVPETDQASNARLVKQTLCTDQASLARFEPLLVESDAMHSARTLNQRECSIDIAILGMGKMVTLPAYFHGSPQSLGLATMWMALLPLTRLDLHRFHEFP